MEPAFARLLLWLLDDPMMPHPLGLMRQVVAAPPFAAGAWNPATTDTELTLSGSNRICLTNDTTAGSTFAVVGKTTGKYYIEHTLTTMLAAVAPNFGVCTALFDFSQPVGNEAQSYGWRSDDAIYDRGTPIAAVTSFFTAGDVLSMLVDCDANSILFYANGVLRYTGALAGVLTGTIFPAIGKSSGGGVGNVWSTNFGQSAWVYNAIPAGVGATGWPNS